MAARKPRQRHPDTEQEPLAPEAEPLAPMEEALAPEVDLKAREQEKADLLDALAKTLTDERSDAIKNREASGIEQDWSEDEDQYDGIDDANRDEHSSAWKTRPPGQSATKKKGQLQSSVYLNITRPAVNIAASRVCNILQPRVSLKPTPVPELIGAAKGELPEQMVQQIGDQFAGQPVQAADAAEAVVRDAMQVMKEATAKAEKAKKRLEDWYVEGKYYAQNRLMIKDAAKIGSGILKGPVPERVRRVAFKAGEIVNDEEIKPKSWRRSVWNCYPDWPACGENIQDGTYHWEKDNITSKRLRALKGGDYLDSQIDAVLEEGPMRAVAPAKKNALTVEPKKGAYEIWYRYGDITKENMEAAGCECDEDQETIHALLTMVNEHVIKITMNPLDNGEFPYDYFAWPQKRKGMPWGVGIARAGRSPARIVVGAVRSMLDNAGRSAGPQVIKGTQVQPDDGADAIVPWKLWNYAEDGDIDDVRKAFAFIEVPMKQVELANIIQMGLKWMEESTNMPMLLQGQQGTAPDRVGIVQILNQNASEFLRDLGSSYDDDVSEPHGGRYYDWLLQYGPDDEKGEFVLDTRGASVNVERMLQDQELLKALQMSLNPVFKKDPAKFMDEYLASRHFDPEKFAYSDQDWQKVVEGMSRGDPRVAVEQMKLQYADQQQQREQAFDASENEKDRQSKAFIAMIDEQIASAEIGSVEAQVLAKMKTELAKTTITGNLQRELSMAEIAHDKDIEVAAHVSDIYKHRNPSSQVMKPIAEPSGRARPGHSFQA